MTQSGILVGTPGYMAPEQALGKRALIGPATDLYALGVMLYQLITGQLPFQADTTLELLRTVASDEPAPPRRLQPRVPRDLEAITLRCLEKQPGDRYPSALALADDLRRFREGKQVSARPVGAVARLIRAGRRRPLVTLLLALLTVSLLGGLGGVTWKWLEADELRGLADAHARQADAEKRAAQYQAYRASLYAARAAMENHDVADAAGHLKAAPEEMRGWEWRHLSSGLDDSSSVMRLPDQGPGFLLARPDQLAIGALTSAGLRITDLDGNERATVPIGPGQRREVSVNQTRRGVRIAVWADNAGFELLDNAGHVLCRVATPENKDFEPAAVTVSPDGRWMVCRMDGDYRRFAVFDAISGKQAAICNGHSGGINAFAFTPDSTRVVSGSVDRTARLWDAATGKLLVTFEGHMSTVENTRFSSDGTRLLTASADATVRQWDVRTGQPIGPPYTGHSGALVTAAYSADGQLVASAGEDRVIRVWRAMNHQDVALLFGHTWQVNELAFDPSGHRLASRSDRHTRHASGDGTVRIWDIDPQAGLPVLRGHAGAIYPVAYSPDGRWLASGSSDKTVRLWDAATGEPCAILPHPADVRALAFGPDGTWLITGNLYGGLLTIWDVATARPRKEIPLHDEKVRFRSLTLSADGTRVAATTEDAMFQNRRLTVIDIESGKRLFSMDGIGLAYSPDRRWLAVVEPDSKTVLLVDAQTHETVARLRGHEEEVQKAAFSPDGRTLATCSLDRTVRLWRVESGGWRVEDEEGSARSKLDPPPGKNPVPSQNPSSSTLHSPPSTLHDPPATLHPSPSTSEASPSTILKGHTDAVYAVTFHPDGTRLATAARDGAVWLWDVSRGEEVARLRAHSGFVWSLAFTPDGASLASGFGNATIRLWDTVPLKERYRARREAAALRPEAEQLVEQLLREKNDLAHVVDALRGDRALSEPRRHAAIREVQRRAQSPATSRGDHHDSH